MFDKVMNFIKDFLDNTQEDIYDFSCDLEGMLVLHYDDMYKEQPKATKILNNEIPDICATGEPGMTKEEIEEFKCALRKEYEKALHTAI